MLNFWRIVPRFIFFLWKCIKSQFLHLCFIQWPFWPLWSHFEVIHAKRKTQTGSTFAPRDFFDSDFGWKSPFSEWKEFCLANNNVVGSNLSYKLERAAHFSSFQARVFCQGIWPSCFELILPHKEFEALLAHQEKPSFGLLKAFGRLLLRPD